MTVQLLLLILGLQSGAGDDAARMARLRDAWAHNLKSKLVEASVAEYAGDADFIDPGGNRVHGSDGLRRLFQTVTGTYDSELEFTSSRVESSGDLAYDSGTYRETLTTRASSKQQHLVGSYLTVYRRDKTGAWLIAEQSWSGAPVEESTH